MSRKRYIARNWGIIETEFNDEPRRNYIWRRFETIGFITDLLNKLHIEKEDMQILINNISDQRNEFHRAARENANRVGKLEKENKELKKEIGELEDEVELLEGKLWNCKHYNR